MKIVFMSSGINSYSLGMSQLVSLCHIHTTAT